MRARALRRQELPTTPTTHAGADHRQVGPRDRRRKPTGRIQRRPTDPYSLGTPGLYEISQRPCKCQTPRRSQTVAIPVARIRNRESRVRMLIDWRRWPPRRAKGTSAVSVHRPRGLCVAYLCPMGRCSDPGSLGAWGLTRKPFVGPSCQRWSAHRAAMPIVWDRKAQQGGRERHRWKRANCRTRAVIGV
jgi:hypothetical protein